MHSTYLVVWQMMEEFFSLMMHTTYLVVWQMMEEFF